MPVLHSDSTDDNKNRKVVGKTKIYDSTSSSFIEVPMIDPDMVPVGTKVDGPALMVSPDTTVVLPTGATATSKSGGYTLVELGLSIKN